MICDHDQINQRCYIKVTVWRKFKTEKKLGNFNNSEVKSSEDEQIKDWCVKIGKNGLQIQRWWSYLKWITGKIFKNQEPKYSLQFSVNNAMSSIQQKRRQIL